MPGRQHTLTFVSIAANSLQYLGALLQKRGDGAQGIEERADTAAPDKRTATGGGR